MDAPLSVLLRDGTHTGASIHMALKAEQVAISINRQPSSSALASSSPLILDLGAAAITVTISGIIDNIGGDPANTTTNFWGMEKMAITDGSTSKDYVIPYKNYLEQKVITNGLSTTTTPWEIEIGDATKPVATGSSALSTGGAVYRGAVVVAQFTQRPGEEDRWVFTIQFTVQWRTDMDQSL